MVMKMNITKTYINKNMDACPHCSSKKIHKYGYYKNGQRYRCTDCRKTFTSFTNMPWSYSKKDISVWKEYIKLMENKSTLEVCKYTLKMNISTAFNWRHKILTFLTNNLNLNKLIGIISMFRDTITENRKGNKNITTPASTFGINFALDDKQQFSFDINSNQLSVKLIDTFLNKFIHKSAYILKTTNAYVNISIKKFNHGKKNNFIKGENAYLVYSLYKEWKKSFKGIATIYEKKYNYFFNYINELSEIFITPLKLII